MKGKNWKKKALAKAIAGVFVCGTLSGNLVAAPDIEIGAIGGFNLTINPTAHPDLAYTNQPYSQGQTTQSNWSFQSSMLKYYQGNIVDVDLYKMHWDTWADGENGTLIHDTDKLLILRPYGALAGHSLFNVGAQNNGQATIINEKNGTVNIIGGLHQDAINTGAGVGGRFSLVNSGGGTINLIGNKGERFYGGKAIDKFAEGENAIALISNSGGGVIKSKTEGEGVFGLRVFLSNGAKGRIENLNLSTMDLSLTNLCIKNSLLDIENGFGSTLSLIEAVSPGTPASEFVSESNLDIKNDGTMLTDGSYINSTLNIKKQR